MAALPEPSSILSFEDARHLVEEHAAHLRPHGKELVELLEGAGQILAEPVLADRNFPPFPVPCVTGTRYGPLIFPACPRPLK